MKATSTTATSTITRKATGTTSSSSTMLMITMIRWIMGLSILELTLWSIHKSMSLDIMPSETEATTDDADAPLLLTRISAKSRSRNAAAEINHNATTRTREQEEDRLKTNLEKRSAVSAAAAAAAAETASAGVSETVHQHWPVASSVAPEDQKDHQEKRDKGDDSDSGNGDNDWRLAIFHHVYIPNNHGNNNDDANTQQVNQALDILREQLSQVVNSSLVMAAAAAAAAAAASSSPAPPVRLFYNTIGLPNVVNAAFMEPYCGSSSSSSSNMLSCQHLQHYDTGFEDLTLQNLHDYCQDDNHVAHQVVYLHPKGSFHPSVAHDYWRRYMTRAATSDKCRLSTRSNSSSSCNVCGLSFNPIWTPFFPGNIWTAQCFFVRKLLPLQEFEQRMRQLKQELLEYAANNETKYTNDWTTSHIYDADRMRGDDIWGIGRYAAEHWIGSHPDLQPCDLSVSTHLNTWFKQRSDEDEMFEWSMAPRQTLIKNRWVGVTNPRKIEQVVQSQALRRREYTFLPGAMHRWIGLYRSIPPKHSWVWSFFPDATYWQEQYDLYRDQLVPRMMMMTTSPSSSTNDNSDTNKRENARNNEITESKEPNVVTTTATITATTAKYIENVNNNNDDDDDRVAIFYHTFVPPNKGDDAIRKVLDIIQEQLGQVGSALAQQRQQQQNTASTGDTNTEKQSTIGTIYYNTVGLRDALNQTFMQKVCTDDNNLHCRHLKHYDRGFEEHTLASIQEYCQQQANPMKRVVYLHSKGAHHDHKNDLNHVWRRALTTAVTSQLCIQPRNDTCNVCGLNFQPIWTLFMPGNMWSAQCSYINQLLPPVQYEQKLRQLATTAKQKYNFTSHIYNHMQMNGDDFWGRGRYAAEHWIGSHPDIRPCDLSRTSDVAFWWNGDKLLDTINHTSEKDEVVPSLLDFQMAPRQASLLGHSWIHVRKLTSIRETLESKELRIKDYVLLAGSIHRWLGLYNTAPAPSSWVWSFFPDGNEWLDALAKWGNDRVLDETLLTDKTTTPL